MSELLGDRYRLGTRIRVGDAFTVYRAEDEVKSGTVAVKVLEATVDERTRARFVTDARAGARVASPHLAAVLDVSTEGPAPYVVREYVTGRTLADALLLRGVFAPEEAIRVELDVLDGLATAHEHGLVHGHLEPRTILLPLTGGVRLADLSVGHPDDDSSRGRPPVSLLSPEQVQGRAPSAAADVYAAGAVLYELLAGVPPFYADPPATVPIEARLGPVPPLSSRRAGLDEGLERIVARALDPDPDQRYPDARAMRTELVEVQGASISQTMIDMPAVRAPQGPGGGSTAASVEAPSQAADGAQAQDAVWGPPARKRQPLLLRALAVLLWVALAVAAFLGGRALVETLRDEPTALSPAATATVSAVPPQTP